MRNNVMLFLKNERGFYATSLDKSEKMIYFQNRESTFKGAGLFETSVLFEKSTYTMMNCDNMVKTARMTRRDVIKTFGNNAVSVVEYELPTGQYLYKIKVDGSVSYVYADAETNEICTLYDSSVISRCKYYSSRGYLCDDKSYTQMLSELEKFNNTSNIELGEVDILTDNIVAKIASKKIYDMLRLHSDVKVWVNNDINRVIVSEERNSRLFGYEGTVCLYCAIAGEIVNTGCEYGIKDIKTELSGYVNVTNKVSDFCEKHYVAIKYNMSERNFKLHKPSEFDFETLAHDAEVDASIKKADADMKSFAKYVSAKNQDSLEKLKAMNYRSYCRI